MNTSVPHLLKAALTLPEGDRADLAYQLLSSLPMPGTSYEDTGFATEVERRIAEFDAGHVSAASLDDVTSRVRNALANRKAP